MLYLFLTIWNISIYIIKNIYSTLSESFWLTLLFHHSQLHYCVPSIPPFNVKRFTSIFCDCCCMMCNVLWLIWGISKCDLFCITAAMVFLSWVLAWCLWFERLSVKKCWTLNSSCVDLLLSSLFTPVIVGFPGNLTAIWEQCIINTSRNQNGACK